MSDAAPGFRARLFAAARAAVARALRSGRARYALVAAALGGVALAAQFPASRLHADSRLDSNLFRGETNEKKIFLERQTTSMYLPRSRSLHYFWLGNDDLAASTVWMKTATYMSREFNYRYSGRKFEWLRKLYGIVADLAPHWQGACRLGGLLLSAVGGDPGGALELLDGGIAANPDSWRLCYEAGLVCLLAPGRSGEAARYFRMATLRPGCPDVVREIIPRVMAEAGRMDLAIHHARGLAKRFHDNKEMRESMVKVLRELVARQEERLLARAVAAFRLRKRELPSGLHDLRRAGLLREFDLAWAEATKTYADEHERLMALYREGEPASAAKAGIADVVASGFLNAAVMDGSFPPPESTDATGKPFRYHAASGTVRSEAVAAIGVRRTLPILRGATATFRSSEARFPSSLDELARFFAEWIRGGKSLQQGWTEAFKDGRAPVHPLSAWGERYTYDPDTGAIYATWPEEARQRTKAREPRINADGR